MPGLRAATGVAQNNSSRCGLEFASTSENPRAADRGDSLRRAAHYLGMETPVQGASPPASHSGWVGGGGVGALGVASPPVARGQDSRAALSPARRSRGSWEAIPACDDRLREVGGDRDGVGIHDLAEPPCPPRAPHDRHVTLTCPARHPHRDDRGRRRRRARPRELSTSAYSLRSRRSRAFSDGGTPRRTGRATDRRPRTRHRQPVRLAASGSRSEGLRLARVRYSSPGRLPLFPAVLRGGSR